MLRRYTNDFKEEAAKNLLPRKREYSYLNYLSPNKTLRQYDNILYRD